MAIVSGLTTSDAFRFGSIYCGIISPTPEPRLVGTMHGMDIYEGFTPHRIVAGIAHRTLSAEEIAEISKLMESL